jgi:hypothetical protein
MNKNWILKDWGFTSMQDLLQSTLHIGSIKPMMVLSVTFGTLSSITDKYLGLEPLVYLSFLILLIVEFITGISASIKEGKKIESKRLGRFIVKIVVYTLMIAIVNILNKSFDDRIVGKIYNFIYWIIIDFITLQLIISVFENLSRLGFQESSRVFNKINKYLSKWFDVKK